MDSYSTDFASVLLRGLAGLGASPSGRPDLALHMGLTAWMRQFGAGPGDAQLALRRLRSAVLDAAALDQVVEPCPLTGVSEQADVVNWALYLVDLLDRAARTDGCDIGSVVDRSIGLLAA